MANNMQYKELRLKWFPIVGVPHQHSATADMNALTEILNFFIAKPLRANKLTIQHEGISTKHKI